MDTALCDARSRDAFRRGGPRARWRGLLAGAIVAVSAATPFAARAGEGGTTHVIPGANATLMDLPPTSPGWFVKPMYMHYSGSASVPIPTAAGLTADLSATANTFVLGGGYTFEQTVLGGAHYTVAAFLPYSWLNVSGNVATPGGVRGIRNSVSGFGDLTVVPMMLAWKHEDWQIDALMPVYAPTGSYQDGRLGNPGLNYWTIDPMVGFAYSNKKAGFNAIAHLGYAINSENPDTDYRSGSVLHLDAAVQQILPAGTGFATLGAEGFYFQQVTCDSGSGATLGCFKGRTAGLGPVLGYIVPMGKQSLSFELKWLAEMDTKNRLNGDYVWFKVVFKF
jgi:hypothetical protein